MTADMPAGPAPGPVPAEAIQAGAIRHAEYCGFTDPDTRDFVIAEVILGAAWPVLAAHAADAERERAEVADALATQAEDYVRDEVPNLIAEARADAAATERERIRQQLARLHSPRRRRAGRAGTCTVCAYDNNRWPCPEVRQLAGTDADLLAAPEGPGQ
jgi:hypothetical protein